MTWALLLFAVIYYRESRNRFFKKAFLVLPLYPVFVTAYQVLEPFTLYQATTHDSLQRAGLMFQNWSNTRIDLPALLPSFIKTDNHGYLPNIVLLLTFVLLVVLALLPTRAGARRRHAGWLPVLLFAGIFSLCSLFPRLDLSAPQQAARAAGPPLPGLFQPRAGGGGRGNELALFRPPPRPPADRDPGPAQGHRARRPQPLRRGAAGAGRRPVRRQSRPPAPARRLLQPADADPPLLPEDQGPPLLPVHVASRSRARRASLPAWLLEITLR